MRAVAGMMPRPPWRQEDSPNFCRRSGRHHFENIKQGKGNFVFFVSATRMEQIKEIAGHGEIMPQKSTDFYPKMISGLTMLPLAPEERL